MQHILLWKGIGYDSLEHCIINTDAHGTSVMSTVIGFQQGQSYHVRYDIHLDATWQVQQINIQHLINGQQGRIALVRKKEGTWLLNGSYAPRFDACTDVDLPLTPLTNSLPIHRLALQEGSAAIIDVIYLDLLAGEINPVRQLYRWANSNTYHYENIPNDFEVDILVDDHGYVVEYPGLFKKVSS